MILCRVRQALTILVLLIGKAASEAVGQHAKCLLHDPASPRCPVVEDALFSAQVAMGVRLHKVWPKGKGVIPHYEVRHILVIIGDWIRTSP